MVSPEHVAGRREGRDAHERRVEHDELRIDAGAVAERHRIRLAIVADRVVGRVVAVLSRRRRPRVEEAPPALSRTRAGLVVAADDDPGRHRHELRGRCEHIRFPCVPAVAPRAARAAGVAFGTRVLAIVVVADVDHEVGRGGGRRVRDGSKRPRRAIVAGLERRAGKAGAASGIAEHGDPLRRRLGQRQRAPGDRGARNAGGYRLLASQHGKRGRLRGRRR